MYINTLYQQKEIYDITRFDITLFDITWHMFIGTTYKTIRYVTNCN